MKTAQLERIRKYRGQVNNKIRLEHTIFGVVDHLIIFRDPECDASEKASM